MKLVVIGAPGAGKGTQAKRLAKHFLVPHVSTGDLLRSHMAVDAEFCRKIKDLMDNGSLVPDEIVVELVSGYLESGFIFDGFPRTVKQADILQKLLSEAGTSLDRVIYVTIDDDIIVERMAGRQSCKSCGAIYNTVYNPPKKTGICDVCGGELYVREDDSERVVRRRLRNYYSLTQPIIEFYRELGLVYEISGLDDIEDITASIIRELESK